MATHVHRPSQARYKFYPAPTPRSGGSKTTTRLDRVAVTGADGTQGVEVLYRD